MPSREEELFAHALELPESARAAFLETACREDRVLRAQVEGLLAAHAAPENLLQPLVIGADALEFDESAGEWIGRYKLRKKLGEGGCGVVWLAEQAEPVQRQVALKVIKPGMDTREVIARFAIERQALAIMDHAGIAKVLDAGETDAGRPFFVMELVRGMRITQYCDEHALSVAARLDLFLQVCHAVQHAHQKGIIHRDLKPSNILVTLPEGGTGGVVKVIDFGIAKATQGRLVDGTLVTAFEQFIGTPVYMSPEQADTSGLDIDTRSDVYSLGVLLYELLAGRPPFDPKALSELGRDEIRRMIREIDPPRPSARFASLESDERAVIAQQRGTDPARLKVLLTGDLDWIVMRALEKDRTRRYGSAAELAADIARHLGHEPVSARPPSKVYRLRKMIRRNRVGVFAAAAITVALVAATIVSTWQAVRAREAQARATRERVSAEELLEFMIGDLRGPLKQVGQLKLLESAAAKALEYYAGRDPAELNRGDLLRHAKALLQLGEVRLDQARYEQARRAFSAAHARSSALLRQDPSSSHALLLRSEAEGWVGLAFRRQGKLDAARDWYLQQRATIESLLARAPDNLQWQRALAEAQHSLAALAVAQGRYQEARDGYLDELAALKKIEMATPSDLRLKAQQADTIAFLGLLAERNGDLAESVRHYADQAARLKEIARLTPEDSHACFKHADGVSFHGALLAITGQVTAARQLIDESRAELERLVAKDPSHRRWEAALLSVILRQAMLDFAVGGLKEAEQSVERARAGFQRMAAEEPGDSRFEARAALAWRLTAEFRHAAARPNAAEAAVRAVSMGEQLVGRSDRMSYERCELANALLISGQIAAARGDGDAARADWERGYALLAPFVSATNDWRALDPAVRLLTLIERHDEARALAKRLQTSGYVPLRPWPRG